MIGITARVACILTAGCLLLSGEVEAALGDEQSRGLALISDTADRICITAKTSGGATSSTSKAQINVALNGLFRALANLDISGATEYTTSSYDGPLEKDVLAASVESDSCKQHVFDTLVNRVLPTESDKSTAPRAPQSSSHAEAVSWRAPKKSAVAVSDGFLAKVDRGDWQNAYQTLSVETRAGADLQSYIAVKQQGRDKIGRTLSRTLIGSMLSDKQPDPNARLYVVAYQSNVEHPFEHTAAPGDEAVVLRLTPDGRWTVLDYYCIICMAANLH